MNSQMRVERYHHDHAPAWDKFVCASKNGTFLICRNYMDYHADRFSDHSLQFFEDDRLIAIMPANVTGHTMSSHGGLTFGGVVSDVGMKAATMLEVFSRMRDYLAGQGITQLLYKAVPYIYHSVPADEDLYALFRNGAKLVRRNLSSTIMAGYRHELSKGRAWSTRRAARSGVEIRESRDFHALMAIADVQLQARHGTRPTHTGAEMELLASRFPQNIKLFGGYRDGVLLGGVIMYDSPRVAHVQYIAASDAGRELGVIDAILDMLLSGSYAVVPYFDFGISTEEGGSRLNTGLIAYKESFGARAVAYDTYQVDLT